MAHPTGAVGYEDITIPQGASWSLGWIYGEGDGPTIPDGWPDEWQGRMHIRERWNTEDVLAFLHSSVEADGLIELDATEGTEEVPALATIVASLTPAASTDWTWTRGVYDIELVHDSGRVIRLVEGKAALSPEVTK